MEQRQNKTLRFLLPYHLRSSYAVPPQQIRTKFDASSNKLRYFIKFATALQLTYIKLMTGE